MPVKRIGQLGFTLVEVLIALALVSTIMTIVYTSLATASRSVDLYKSRLAASDRASLVLRLMARQLRCAYLPALGTSPTAPPAPEGTNPAPGVSTITHTGPIEMAGDCLSFVTTAGEAPGSDKAQSLARVRYRCDQAAGTLSIAYESFVFEGMGLLEAPNWRPILTGVKNLEVQFSDGHDWHSDWTEGPDQTLPKAVKIALSVVDRRNRLHDFTTTVPLGCCVAAPAQQVQTPVGKL